MTAPASSLPLRIGSAAQFEELRGYLQRLDFTEAAICRRTGFKTIFDFQTVLEGRTEGVEIRDALDVLIRLLMDEQTLGEEPISLLPEPMLANLEALGVVERAPGEPVRRYATVVLYPVAGVYIVSDRTFPPEGTVIKLPVDAVYSAITSNTGRFLSILPDDPCDALLDLCAGTGIGAIRGASKYAREAWAADLGFRSVHFSNFNARLNGLENVKAVQGDLYGAVAGLTFDRIVAHPPYVPAKDQKLLFRDGGEDGEQILAKVVAGLPQYLRPGGRFYCLTLATDRREETLEQRVRRWLGPAQSDFDVFIVETEYGRRPDQFLDKIAKAKGRLGELGDRAKLYEQLEVVGVFYGTIVVQRHLSGGAALTARTRKATSASRDAIEWFRRWEIAAVEPEFQTVLMQSRLRFAAGASLIVTHTAPEGQLVPTKFDLRVSYPLAREASVEPWVAVLLGACNGERTARELFLTLKQQEVIAPEMSEDEFGTVLKQLCGNGFLEHERHPLPVRAKAS